VLIADPIVASLVTIRADQGNWQPQFLRIVTGLSWTHVTECSSANWVSSTQADNNSRKLRLPDSLVCPCPNNTYKRDLCAKDNNCLKIYYSTMPSLNAWITCNRKPSSNYQPEWAMAGLQEPACFSPTHYKMEIKHFTFSGKLQHSV
jgi:hypothetical protein